MKNLLKKTIIQNYILVLGTIALSGFVLFFNSKSSAILFTLYSFFIFKTRRKVFDKTAIYYFFFLLILYFAQTYLFGFFSILSLGNLLMIYLLPYFVIKSVGEKYTEIYVNIVYFFTLISFWLYIPSFISKDIHELVGKIPILIGSEDLQDLIIYTWEPYTDNYLRNSGPFWEPGANAGFILIAIIFNLCDSKKLVNKKNIVFIIAIIFTFSVAGYAALVVLVFSYFLFDKPVVYKIIFTPFLLIITWYAYFNIEFMSDKINKNLEYSANIDEIANGRGRFTSAMLDLEDINNYPITGRGRNEATRFKYQGEDSLKENHRTNGLTNYAVQYGLIGFFVYFSMMFTSFKSLCTYYSFNVYFSFVFLITILIIGFSQTFFQNPVFVSLIFLLFIFRKSLTKIEISNSNSNL